ncbi:MAG TPA: glucose sorbosone dehydrogenase [Candidatus Moranbacteria bacterium]|nr:glucose sorbosone dehydrogenase [Candidatus Moranbacteria bacterium]
MKIYKPIIILLTFAIIAIASFYLLYSPKERTTLNKNVDNLKIILSQNSTSPQDEEKTEVIVENLNIPWEIVFLSDGSMLITERAGTLKKMGNNGFEIQVPNAVSLGEGGLLGLALHPDYENNQWIYLYHTTRTNAGLRNIVERYKLSDNQLTERKVIMENIPAAQNHNGGRIKFGPDGFLYITTGDAQNSNSAQDKNSLAGKILRLKDDGSLPEDNPFGNPVYSYGHRNVQGITWDSQNNLWATEHGRSGAASGYDELNLIRKGANYGWPQIQGDQNREGMESSVINSGATNTWAPSGMAYQNGSIFFAGLRGEALYEYEIDSKELKTHLKGEFGRIRNIIVGPGNDLYILTNNTDGRGTPRGGDDKVIKINSSFFEGDEKKSLYFFKMHAMFSPSANVNLN